MIEKFLEIAERKVSVLDDYGDESWDELRRCIESCLQKIAKREGVEGSIRTWMKQTPESAHESAFFYASGPSVQFRQLAAHLESAFRKYHAQRPRRDHVSSDFTGTEFETHVARLLPYIGFVDICGTPATGDQGADLLARMNGRLFVIQTKFYSAPVGNKAVQEVAAAVHFYGGDEGWVATNSTFTPSAKALAQKSGVRLVDGEVLSEIERRIRSAESDH